MSKTFTLNIPISKIDEEQRIVTGIATSETVDSQGDIVDFEASKKAFTEWPGNIREMHNPIAIGKGIDVQFDEDNKAVVVSAKISESADGENAWTKVKEGVLTGFSIGGRIFKVTKDKAQEGVDRIVDYALSELSLVDNPANPDAQLVMVKSFDGNLQRVEKEIHKGFKEPWWVGQYMKKGGVSVVDGDPRDANGNTVSEVSSNTPVKGGTKVPKNVYGKDGKTVTAKSKEAEIKKSVYDASEALNLCMNLTWLIMLEQDEQDQVKDLVTAFNALKDFAQKEIAEDDDLKWLDEYNEAVELARKAIDLRKDKIMADKKVSKTNVHAGEERDENADVTQTQEEAGRPVNDTEERATEAGVPPKGSETDVTVQTEGEEASNDDAEDESDESKETETPTDEDTKDEDKKTEDKSDDAKSDVKTDDKGKDEGKADEPSDLIKSVQSIVTKAISDAREGDLAKVTKSVEDLGDKVEKAFASLEDRVKTLENRPVETKAKASFIVNKGEEEVEKSAELKELEKRQEELIADPSLAKPGEMAELSIKMRKALAAQNTK